MPYIDNSFQPFFFGSVIAMYAMAAHHHLMNNNAGVDFLIASFVKELFAMCQALC